MWLVLGNVGIYLITVPVAITSNQINKIFNRNLIIERDVNCYYRLAENNKIIQAKYNVVIGNHLVIIS